MTFLFMSGPLSLSFLSGKYQPLFVFSILVGGWWMWVVHRRRHSHKRIEVSYDDGKCPSVLSVSFVGEGGGNGCRS